MATLEVPQPRVVEASEQRMNALVSGYIAPGPDVVAGARKMYRATLLVGPMGTGKTTWAENKLGELVERLLGEGVDEQQVCYVYSQETALSRIVSEMARDLDLRRCLYLYIFNDDAIAGEGAMGRRAMSEENVAENQYYVMIRHRLEAMGFDRYLHVLHAAQVYTLIDITFRRTAALKVFKDYPDEPADHKTLTRMLGAAGMAALLELSVKLYTGTAEEILEAANTGVALFKRFRRLTRARHGASAVLHRVQNTRIRPEDPEPPDRERAYQQLLRIVRKLRRDRLVKYRHGKAYIDLPDRQIYIGRAHVIKQITGEARRPEKHRDVTSR